MMFHKTVLATACLAAFVSDGAFAQGLTAPALVTGSNAESEYEFIHATSGNVSIGSVEDPAKTLEITGTQLSTGSAHAINIGINSPTSTGSVTIIAKDVTVGSSIWTHAGSSITFGDKDYFLNSLSITGEFKKFIPKATEQKGEAEVTDASDIYAQNVTINGTLKDSVTFHASDDPENQVLTGKEFKIGGDRVVRVEAGSVVVDTIQAAIDTSVAPTSEAQHVGGQIYLGSEEHPLVLVGEKDHRVNLEVHNNGLLSIFADAIYASNINPSETTAANQQPVYDKDGSAQLIIGSEKSFVNLLDVSGYIGNVTQEQKQQTFFVNHAVIDNLNHGVIFKANDNASQDFLIGNINLQGNKIAIEKGTVQVARSIQLQHGEIILGTKERALDSVSIGTAAEKDAYWGESVPDFGSLRVMGDGALSVYASDLLVTSKTGERGSAAIEAWNTSGDVNKEHFNGSITLDATQNMRINGDIIAGKGSEPSGGNANQTDTVIKINQDKAAQSLIINGDIMTVQDADKQAYGTVNIYLGNAKSSLTGAVLDETVNTAKGTHLEIANGGRWTATGSSLVTGVELDGGVIDNSGSAEQTITAGSLTGNGMVIAKGELLEDGSIKTSLVTTAPVENGSHVVAYYDGITADDVVGRNEENLKGTLGVATTDIVQGGDLYEFSQERDIYGNIVGQTIQTSDKLESFKGATAASLVQWRNQVNHLMKRLGDVRQQPSGIGAWARVYGGEYKWSDDNTVDMSSTTVQVGGDGRIGEWIVGGAFSYTDSSFDINRGDGDGDLYSLAVYGTRMFDNGAYIDLVARYGYIKNDLTVQNMGIDTKSNAFGVSAEAGHQFKFLGSAYVEPQFEVSYGYVEGDEAIASNGVKIDQDDYQTLVTRVGIRTGFDFPENAGTIYAHVSYSYDFLGDADATASKGNYRPVSLDDDLGGGWVTYGVGAQFKIGDSTFAYADLERTSGGDVENPYAFNVGFRYIF